MDDDLPPSPFIKKRRGIRPSGSSSSLRSLAASPTASTSNLSFAQDEDDDIGAPTVVRSIKKTTFGRLKDREGGTKPKSSRLSFGGGEEEEESDQSFSITRGNDSPRRLLRASGSSTSLSQDLEQATISPSGPSTPTPARSIYSKEYLNQLKASNFSTPPATGRGGGDYDALTRSKFGEVIDDEMGTSIPTTSAIAEAKEKRERRRAEGGGTGGDGFISLEVGMVSKSGESRLIREDDEIGDGDEDLADYTGAKESIPLGKKANRAAAEKMRSGMVEMIQDAEEDEEDEEMRDWENAQIKRGEQGREAPSSTKKAYRATAIPTPTAVPALAAVASRLATALSTLKLSRTVDTAALTHFSHEREELTEQEKELRVEVERVGEKNRWFTDFKIFIEEVAAFLDEKVPALEKIEKENLHIQKERYEIVNRRRYEDDSDDVALFTGAQVPTTFSLVPDTTPVATEPEVDEMGRSRREDDTTPRSAVRIARRAARSRRIAVKYPNSASPEEESTWTDDELSPGDSSDLGDALLSLRDSLGKLFEDVKADDFRDPDLGIRRKFEEWRDKFGEEYSNAFGGLALVGVWEFWARVEMALWNPFEIEQLAKTPPGLDAYKWHSKLGSYGHTEESYTQEGDADESEVVVNALVTSVIVPRLEKLARETFDPMSRKQTTRALGLIEEVSYSVEKTSPRFETLVQSFLYRLQLTVTQSQSLVAPHLSAISLPSNSFDPSTFASRNNFLQRQYKFLQNAVRWRRYAKGMRLSALGEEVGGGGTLDELLVRECVAKVMLPILEAGWGTGGSEIAARVLLILPADSMPPALRRRLEGEK